MQIPILVEPVANNGYRARTGEPLALSAEGATAEEALARVRQLLAERLAAGTRVEAFELPPGNNPWLRGAGMFKDDPYFEGWQEAIAQRRREIDADPNIP